MMLPVLIGLPGAGKSMLSRRVAEVLGLSLFASDESFRECRAVLSDHDPRREIMTRLLARIASDPRVERLREDALRDDGRGRCSLVDGGLFREHGEDLFRRYEAEMLRWHDERGAFAGTVPDLSSSAPLLPEVREMFSPARGYHPILLDASTDAIARNLLADYRAVLLRRLDDAGATMRGGYERRFDAVLAGRDIVDPEARRDLLAEAEAMTRAAAAKRMPIFESYAVSRLRVSPTATPDELVVQVVALVERPRQ